MKIYKNPIIAGFNPDPSICRVGNDFFIVTSTFEYFPGVPVYHSRNLVNWELIGHCLTDIEQLPLEGCFASGGIYAPTIRFHDGIFYMATTNVSSMGNFIVNTENPSRGWSKPVKVEQSGIDPSLFFDDDGKVYYTSTGRDSSGRNGIQMCEINPLTGMRLSESKIISCGCGGCYPEAPHIYKNNGYYYLMVAEGGTEYGHRETIQRGRSPWGPFEPCPHNPILFHQHLLGKSPIQATGHADLVEDQNGNWWAVCLGVRPVPYGLLHNLGRETFLSPVVWVDGWPVIGDNGVISLEMSGPLPGEPMQRNDDFCDNFDEKQLNPRWNFIRNPADGSCDLSIRPGCVTLCGGTGLSEPNCSPTFIGVRQTSHNMRAIATLIGELSHEQRAGLCAYYGSNYHYEIYLENHNGSYFVGVSRRVHDLESEVFRAAISYDGKIKLQISADTKAYYFAYSTTDGQIVDTVQGSVAGLCTEGTERMTFTGTYIGIFSIGGAASFDTFEMENE